MVPVHQPMTYSPTPRARVGMVESKKLEGKFTITKKEEETGLECAAYPDGEGRSETRVRRIR